MKHIKSFNLEHWINNQVQVWEQAKHVVEKTSEPLPFITISREYGCRAASKVMKLVEELNKIEGTNLWQLYDKSLLDKIIENEGISQKLMETLDTKRRDEMTEFMRTVLTDYPPQVAAYKMLIKAIRTLAFQGKKVIVGRASEVITRDIKNGIHIKLVAPLAYRVKSIMETQGVTDRLEAERIVKEKEELRHAFMTHYIHFDSHKVDAYDLVINVEKFTDDEIAQLIIGTLRAKHFLK